MLTFKTWESPTNNLMAHIKTLKKEEESILKGIDGERRCTQGGN